MTLTVTLDTAKTLTTKWIIGTAEVRNCLVNLGRVLDSGELLTGTPVITAALHQDDQDTGPGPEAQFAVDESTDTSFVVDSTITNQGRNAGVVTMAETGESVAIDQGVVFTLDASAAMVGAWHRIKISCGTDAGNAQTLIAYALVKVADR